MPDVFDGLARCQAVVQIGNDAYVQAGASGMARDFLHQMSVARHAYENLVDKLRPRDR